MKWLRDDPFWMLKSKIDTDDIDNYSSKISSSEDRDNESEVFDREFFVQCTDFFYLSMHRLLNN